MPLSCPCRRFAVPAGRRGGGAGNGSRADGTSKLEDQRWQYLPVGVSDVFVGPDQRVWYVANDHGVKSGGFTRDVARDIIASEFERENPHAYPIVLFERSCQARVVLSLFWRAGRTRFWAATAVAGSNPSTNLSAAAAARGRDWPTAPALTVPWRRTTGCL